MANKKYFPFSRPIQVGVKNLSKVLSIALWAFSVAEILVFIFVVFQLSFWVGFFGGLGIATELFVGLFFL